MEFFDRIDVVRDRWNVLKHPFYERWSRGELDSWELAFYAGEYRHAVIALADATASTARAAEPSVQAEVEAHAAEEAAHIELWDGFADELDADLTRPPRPETRACVDAWTAGRDALEGLVVTYAIEAGQPAISRTKLEGLLEHYGVDDRRATAYFSLHGTRDREHAAHSHALIEERLEGADEERLVAIAETALRGNWELLDGVEHACGR